MSTAVPPVGNGQQTNTSLPFLSGLKAIEAEESKISHYLIKHEKLIIAVLVVAASIGFYVKVVGWLYNHDKLKDSEAHEAAAVQLAAEQATASKNVQAEAQYEELKAQLDATRAQLSAQIAQRDADTKKQQLADQTLPLTNLYSRWATLLGGEGYYGGKIGYEGDSTGRTYLDETGARQSVQMLEEVPQLKSDLKAETTIAVNDATQIASITDLNTGLHTQIDQLNGVIVKNGAACEADKTLMRAEFRKSKLKWIIGAFTAGFLLRSFIHPAGAVSPTAVGNVSVPAL